MDSEMIWDILKFPNFQYYPTGCTILEYGKAFWLWPFQIESGSAFMSMAQPLKLWPITQKAVPYSSMAQPAGEYSKVGNFRMSQIISESIIPIYISNKQVHIPFPFPISQLCLVPYLNKKMLFTITIQNTVSHQSPWSCGFHLFNSYKIVITQH